MAFLNKKEEVIDFKLTQFGKRLVASGFFKPVYYAFFDDDIIYDKQYNPGPSSYGVENQNLIQDRIKDSIRFKTQYTSTGIETSYEKETKKIEENEAPLFAPITSLQSQVEKDKILEFPLSKVHPGTQKTSGISVKAISCKFKHKDNTVTYSTTGSGGSKKTPLLKTEISYNVIQDTLNASESRLEENSGVVVDGEYSFILDDKEYEFLDGSKISINENDILLDFLESNTTYIKDNFEVEFFEIKQKTETAGEYAETEITFFPNKESELLTGGATVFTFITTDQTTVTVTAGNGTTFEDINNPTFEVVSHSPPRFTDTVATAFQFAECINANPKLEARLKFAGTPRVVIRQLLDGVAGNTPIEVTDPNSDNGISIGNNGFTGGSNGPVTESIEPLSLEQVTELFEINTDLDIEGITSLNNKTKSFFLS